MQFVIQGKTGVWFLGCGRFGRAGQQPQRRDAEKFGDGHDIFGRRVGMTGFPGGNRAGRDAERFGEGVQFRVVMSGIIENALTNTQRIHFLS